MTGIVAGVILLIVLLLIAAVFILVNGYVSPFDNDCQQFWTPEDDKEYWSKLEEDYSWNRDLDPYYKIDTEYRPDGLRVEDYDKEFWGIDKRAEE